MQQTEGIAATAASGGSTTAGQQDAKLKSESAAHLSGFLAENSIVIMMLVEDHLRLQSKLFSSSHSVDGPEFPVSLTSFTSSHSNSLARDMGESSEILDSRRSSLSSESGDPSLDVCMLLCRLFLTTLN